MNRKYRTRSTIAVATLVAFLSLMLIFSACEKRPDTITGVSAEQTTPGLAKSDNGMIGINIVLKTAVTDAIVKELGSYGNVLDVMYEINALRILGKADKIPVIQSLPFVEAVTPDAEREGGPIDTVPVENFADGLSTWNLDAINVTDVGYNNRKVDYNGDGVYIGLLDTGLLDSWRQYFPEERIAVQLAKSFGGGGLAGVVSEQPNKWEHDQVSHGTHVASTIIGYNFYGTRINGVAPMATIIPVKVLNQNGSGWSSVIARGITYIADLKAGPLKKHPVVINMSLGGSRLDVLETAAIDYAISKGVIIVASAGNGGTNGMGYPGAYAPVISVAASGWIGEWNLTDGGAWWWKTNVVDPTNPADYYIAEFSSRALAGQDLDVAAPGSWVVGPWQTNSGQISYYFSGGTSMACPHVTGIVALMAQKNPGLTALQAENKLEASAIPLAAGSLTVRNPDGSSRIVTWGSDATGAGLVTANAALQ